jgi:hypothetical protein
VDPEREGTRYFKIQVGFHLPPEVNFDKMMLALKGKLINWSNNMLLLTGRILVANQVLFASIWYLAACWNPDPRMCSQVRGLIRNFIWGGKEAPARAKVKWDTLALPTSQGGLGVTDPKSQSEALMAKLFIRGLTPGREPWKELVRHNADQTRLLVHGTRLLVHGKGPSNPDLNWLLATPKLKRLKCSMWKSIVGAWLHARPGLTKSDPTTSAEIFKQLLFGNPSILNSKGIPLGVGGMREGSPFAQSGCCRVKDIWNDAAKDWKGLSDLGMCRHPSNRLCRETITSSIPWCPDEHECHIRAGDWITNPTPNAGSPLDWVYIVLELAGVTITVLEFQKILPGGYIQATTNQAIKISTVNLRLIRVFS